QPDLGTIVLRVVARKLFDRSPPRSDSRLTARNEARPARPWQRVPDHKHRGDFRRRIPMQRPAFVVSLLLAVLLGHEALGEHGQDTAMTLQEAIDTALAQHPALRVGQATVEAAQQRVRQQVAGYLPSGGYIYNYTRKEQAVSAAVGGVQAGQQVRTTSQLFNFNSTNFSMSQLLFDFGRTLDSIRAAIAAVDASNADLETTRQTVIFNTKQAYYSVLANQRLLQVADETVQQNQKHLEEA